MIYRSSANPHTKLAPPMKTLFYGVEVSLAKSELCEEVEVA